MKRKEDGNAKKRPEVKRKEDINAKGRPEVKRKEDGNAKERPEVKRKEDSNAKEKNRGDEQNIWTFLSNGSDGPYNGPPMAPMADLVAEHSPRV